jgi:hypothetical protein
VFWRVTSHTASPRTVVTTTTQLTMPAMSEADSETMFSSCKSKYWLVTLIRNRKVTVRPGAAVVVAADGIALLLLLLAPLVVDAPALLIWSVVDSTSSGVGVTKPGDVPPLLGGGPTVAAVEVLLLLLPVEPEGAEKQQHVLDSVAFVHLGRFAEVNAALHDSLPRVDNVPAVAVDMGSAGRHAAQQLPDSALYRSVVLTRTPPLAVATTYSVGN